jgi:hypothetical protein
MGSGGSIKVKSRSFERSFLLASGLTLVLAWACSSPVATPIGAPLPPEDCAGAPAATDAVFLIGDAGAPRLPIRDTGELVDPVLLNLRDDVREQTERLGEGHVTVVFLGDNVYWDGLPLEGERGRRQGERILEAQIAASNPASAIFVMGNHDWHIEGPLGWERVLAQRRFLETFTPRVATRPLAGCAGPDHIDIGETLRFVFMDPIGYGHLLDLPEEHKQHCPDRTFEEAYLDLAAEFDHPEGRHVVLALHHPLVTAGPHGGHFTWKQHLFPLTDFWPWAWVPLPVIGSAYPLSRQLGITGTDATSRAYRRSIARIYRATRPRVPSVFAGGHEHSLQVHRDALGAYYLVSGSGSQADRVEPMESAMLAEASKGYMRIDLHADGALGVTVLALRDGKNAEPIFRHCLADQPPGPQRIRRHPGSP